MRFIHRVRKGTRPVFTPILSALQSLLLSVVDLPFSGLYLVLNCAYFVNSDLKDMLLPIQVAQSVALGVELLNSQIFCHLQVVAVYKFWFSERIFLEARVELN